MRAGEGEEGERRESGVAEKSRREREVETDINVTNRMHMNSSRRVSTYSPRSSTLT